MRTSTLRRAAACLSRSSNVSSTRTSRRFLSSPANPSKSSADAKGPTFPSPPPNEAGGSGLYIILTAALFGAGYYFKDDIFGYFGESNKKAPIVVNSTKVAPSDPLATENGVKEVKKVIEVAEMKLEPIIATERKQEAASKTDEKKVQEKVVKKTTATDWKQVREEIVKVLDDPKHDDGSYGPVLVRLAWHSAGTFDKKTGKGGTEGAAMRWDPEAGWGANKGLDKARAVLEPIKQKFPDITYSDLWSYAGTVAIEEMGGPEMKWRPGRKDVLLGENVLPDGLLPDADGREFKSEPARHVRFIFNRMGFNDQEIVALIGAHALGRCHTQNSGYEGPWTRAPTTFSNQYFKLLSEEKWVKRKWNGPEQYENENGKDLMMLPADLALVQDAGFKKYVDLYAKDEDKFFTDFGKAWLKLQENGVRKFHGWRRYILFGPRE